MYRDKKHRGLRRYYRSLEADKDFYKTLLRFKNEEIEPCEIYWHTHFDWNYFGNSSFKRRKPHLDKMFRQFELYSSLASGFKTEFELYLVINDFNSGEDALFMHAHIPFFDKSEFQLNSTLKNGSLKEYLSNLDDFEIYYRKNPKDEDFCLLFKKNIGCSPFKPAGVNFD